VLAQEARACEALERAKGEGFSHVPDGKIITCDRYEEPASASKARSSTVAIQRSLRCWGRQGFALFTGRWRTLHHITASPGEIGSIARQRSRNAVA
jgi:hypothetical protein